MSGRRDFLRSGVVSALGVSLWRPGRSIPAGLVRASLRGAGDTFVDLRRPPDAVTVQTDSGFRDLMATPGRRFEAGRITVTTPPTDHGVELSLAAPADAVQRIHLRWRGALGAVALVVGDAWERAYGDLEWRGMAPDRVMPWYAATDDGHSTHCYGVRTGAAALCFWQIDADGISFWADVRSGGAALQLGARELRVCEVMAQQGTHRERAFGALRRFCQLMSPAPRLPGSPVYGHNDWYYAYGNNSATSVLADAARIVELSPTGANRPFVVIDDGWQPERGAAKRGVGEWDRGNERFPDMPGLAGRITAAGARPGIWMRPLLAPKDAPGEWRLPRDASYLDPTHPAVLEKVAADVARIRGWGFDLVKHDYSTFDILGRWGRTMGAAITRDGWTFGTGPVRTTAEVIGDFYQAIRRGAGTGLVIGCNTISHLSAGVFEMCRIGDDTSGQEWIRVPRMGVNALAYRGVQQGAFYVADPDCVGVTSDIPWEKNRQWLDLLSRSGTMLFVSLAPDAMTDTVRRDVRAALALAAAPQPLGEPLDWQRTLWPRDWRLAGHEEHFDWTGAGGLSTAG